MPKKVCIFYLVQVTNVPSVSKTHEFGPGRYNIIPCNYSSNVECKFELNVYSTEAGSTAFSPIPAGVLSLEVCLTPRPVLIFRANGTQILPEAASMT